MNLRLLLSFASPYRVTLALAATLMLIETATALLVPWLGGEFAAGLLSAGHTNVGPILLALLALFAVQALLKFVNGYILGRTAAKILADLRIHIYDHLQALPIAFFHQRRQGDILALLTRELAQLSGFITGTMLSVIPLLLTAGGAILLMFRIDARLAGLASVLIPLFYLLMKILGRRLRPLAVQLQKAEAEAVATAEENLGMLPAIKAFTREVNESQNHSKQVHHVMKLNTKQQRIYAALQPAVQFTAAAALLVLLWLASGLVDGGEMTPAELVSFLLYAALLARPVGALASVYGQTQTARGTLSRLQNVLGECPESHFGGSLVLAPVHGDITFRNVTFSYQGRPPILRNIDLDIKAGEAIAITGVNGAGKSTLAQLLIRLHEPCSGQIFIDGFDIASVNLHSLRSQIGLVPQRVLLLNGTVRDNIAYGKPDASDREIEQASRAAQAHAFIIGLPQGYNTLIGDNGIKLSGGQRQRLALARALLKAPPILILDEATAMFDPEGEASFVDGCHETLSGRTVILITHRPASLALANRILTLENGQIGPYASDREPAIAQTVRR